MTMGTPHYSTRPPCVRCFRLSGASMAATTSREQVPWCSIMPCIIGERRRLLRHREELRLRRLQLHCIHRQLSLKELDALKHTSRYVYLILRSTCLLHVTRIGGVPHSRLVLVTSNLDRVSCRTHTRNSLVAVLMRVTRGRQRLAVCCAGRRTPDHAIGGMRPWVCIVRGCATIVWM
jgi:hypothetical protein